MPDTEQGVRFKAQKNLWQKRAKALGKGYEYRLFDLPRETQAAIAISKKFLHPALGTCAESTQAGSPLPADDCAATQSGGFSGTAKPCGSSFTADDGPCLSGSAVSLTTAGTGSFLESKLGMVIPTVQDNSRDARIAEASRRLRIIEPLLKLPPRFPGRRAMAAGIARDKDVSVATLYRWVDDYKRGGFHALVCKHRSDLGQARVIVSSQFERVMKGLGVKHEKVVELSEWLLQLVRSLWAAGGTSTAQIWNEASARLGLKLIEAGLDEISARAVGKIKMPRRFIEAEQKFKIVATANRNAKAIYDHHLPAVVRTRENLLPGDLVFGDISPLDIPVLRPDNSVAYARMITWMDAATTWLFTTLYLCPQGTGVRQEHVARSFTSMCEESPFGMALRLYLDNGSEYQWEEMLNAWSELAYLTGGQTHIELSSMLPPAGRIIRSIPFRPRGKLIEGAFGNLRHLFGWHPAFQGGNRMAKRCANLGESVKPIPYDELQAFVAAAMADYHATPQSGQLDGKSPQEALDMHLNNGWKPTRVDREVLLLAFSDQEKRSAKAGIINYAGREWYADFLVGLDQKVDVRYPKHDPHCLFVFDKGKFIGVALPEHKYGLLENAGAVEAGRRRKVLKDAINNLSGQVETIQTEEMLGSRGKLMGVSETVERAKQLAAPVTLSDEAKQLIAAKKKAMEQRAEAALVEAAKKTNPEKLERWNLPPDPEDAIWRAKYEDD
ncbi:Mu transposase, C-terminal [Nitrosomonas aestuarii]|uniref:Mu transposase, C-terminal n=2 Tax=Nitrosomonas aestuarii TaxID=52441 RepID=A0A1I4DHU2_9PROT|nr:Mu transposase, C-terminal [Nitrosomonas aestuarii]